MTELPLRIAFSPGEFNLSDQAHTRYVNRLFAWAEDKKVDVIGGTEAADSLDNNTRDLLLDLGPEYGFRINVNDAGVWAGCRKAFGFVHQFTWEEVIPAQKGPAAKGGHGPRGIVAMHVTARDKGYGPISFGVSHWITHGTDPGTVRGHANTVLDTEIGHWSQKAGKGRALAFYAGDTNGDLATFDGDPFISCWDEAGKHPGTEGKRTIDIIGKYAQDRRVVLDNCFAFDDDRLPLPVDHSTVLANYIVESLP